jgi:predicted transcriptional regulator
MREQLVRNLLFRTVLGGLTADAVAYFCHHETNRGTDHNVNLRLIHFIRAHGYVSNRSTAAEIGTSPAKVRERLQVLFGARLIAPLRSGYVLTEAGQTFLDIVDRFVTEVRAGAFTPQFVYILRKAGLALDDLAYRYVTGAENALSPLQWLVFGLMPHRADSFAPEWSLPGDGLIEMARAAIGAGPDWPSARMLTGTMEAERP